MKTSLEIYFINFLNGKVSFSKQIVNLDQEPDELVKQKAKAAGYTGDFYHHSTSWRSYDGRIILTYLVYSPDFTPSVNKQVKLSKITDKVLLHALRHFKFLAENKEVKVSSATQKVIAELPFALAGKIN